jgi:fatty-acyl-CoA synthase
VNIGLWIQHYAGTKPSRPALTSGSTTISWAELGESVASMAVGLARAGVAPGDRVAVMMSNHIEAVTSYFAAVSRGAVAVPLNVRWQLREIEQAIADAGAGVLICDGDHVQIAADLLRQRGSLRVAYVDAQEDRSAGIAPLSDLKVSAGSFSVMPRHQLDVADIMYTAGTSGRPKGVCHQHGYHWANAIGRSTFANITPEDVGFAVSPIFHVGGQSILMSSLLRGCHVVLLPKWDIDRFFDALRSHRVTYAHLVTTLLVDIVKSAGIYRNQGISSMRVTLTGGAAVPVEMLTEYEEMIGGLVSTGYGRTEGAACYNPIDRNTRKLQSNGLPIVHATEIRVVAESGEVCRPNDTGEIRVKGDAVSVGYWRMPAETAAAFDTDHWMHTGDLGLFDDDGFLFFLGRSDQMIKTGGENVYPSDVEKVLLQHPAVVDAAVVGVPDPRWGEVVVANVVRAVPSLSEAELDDWCRPHLARFKRPRRWLFVERIERLGTQKVDYRAVRERSLHHLGIGGKP